MTEVVLNIRKLKVAEPYSWDNVPFIGHGLNNMLEFQQKMHRHITKIIIEAGEPTQIEYFIYPGRWIDRLYENGMLKMGTL